MKKILLFPIFFVLLTGFSLGETFEEYKKQITKEYDDYVEKLNEEFNEYKKVMSEEYNKYIQEISNYWDDKKVSTKKVWVEYSPDKKERKIVDFENNTITIQSKTKDPEVVKKILKDTLKQKISDAYENDQVSKNTEKRLKDKITTGVYGTVSNDNVLKPYLQNGDIKNIINTVKKTTTVKTYKDNKGIDTTELTVKLPTPTLQKKAEFVKNDVMDNAVKQRIAPELIFSIIHNESDFNPMAKSYVPAYGLMQIVPKTAGADATKLLYGKPKILMPSYLYNPSNNITIGSAYVSLLYYSYLKDIEDPKSRLYCTIAAYNTGAGNVARAFVGSTNISKALVVINKMTPEEVYETLKKKLPYDETKNYLDKVTDKISLYRVVK